MSLNFESTPYDQLVEKWSPVLDHGDLPSIGDYHKKRVTAVLLENQVKAIQEERSQQNLFEAAPTVSMAGNYATGQVGSAGNFAGYDPVLISLVRRAMPNVVAYDIAGVQPMTAPTGLIFAMRARYNGITANGGLNTPEALFDEPWARFSGASGINIAQTSGAIGVTGLLNGHTLGVFAGMTSSSIR